MSTEENKVIVRRFGEEMNKGNLAAIDETFDPSFVNHNPALGVTPDRAGIKQYWAIMFRAFPDLQGTVDDIIAEGDKVAVRITTHGTHKGELVGIPPTGKQVTGSGISIVRFSGGKIVERWNVSDTFGMMQQMGAIPTPRQG